MAYVYLAIAIMAEVIATSFLKIADGFTKPIPSIASIVGYCISFYCLSLVLRTIPVGISYAIWAGAGVVLITLVGIFAFKQTLDLAAIIGMVFIILGVGIIQLFSKSVGN